MEHPPASSPESKEVAPTPKLTLGKSPEGHPAIHVHNPSPQLRNLLRRVMTANMSGDPSYELKAKAHPFLQCDSDEYMMIEFWTNRQNSIKDFVDHLNAEIAASISQKK